MGKHDLILKGIAAAAETKGDGLDALVNMNEAMFGPDDPDTQFVKWMRDAMRGPGIRQAAADLELQVEEGPDFAKRLRTAYIMKLHEQD